MNTKTDDEPKATKKALTIYGGTRLSAGGRKILAEITPEQREAIQKCPATSYSETMQKQWKSAPQTAELALMIAGLLKSGEGEVTVRNFMTNMKTRWNVLDMPYLKSVRDAAQNILDAEKRALAKGDDTNVVNEDDFKAQCNYAMHAIEAGNRPTGKPTLFQRNGQWVEIRWQGDPLRAVIVELDRKTFGSRLNEITDWRKRAGEGDHFRYVSAPDDVVQQVFDHPEKPVPELRGVISVPMYSEDGKLIMIPGYHSSGYFYAPPDGLEVIRPSRSLTPADLAKARETLVDILCDFEMDGVSRADLERAVLRGEGEKCWAKGTTAVPPSFLSAVGFLLEQLVRPMISGPVMPLLISKTARRAGGGLLASILQVIVSGTTGMRPLAASEEERRKSIIGALRSGASVIAWDNLPSSRVIDSPTLATLFTEGVYVDRELGQSKDITINVTTSFMLIGNRPRMTDELIQRMTLLELVPQTANPEKRTGWKHAALPAHVSEHRGEILSALLVLVENWIAKGMPKPKHAPIIGRFERYRHVIGGILEAASPHWTSWQSNRDKLATVAGDEQEDGWVSLFDTWVEKHGLGEKGRLEVHALTDLACENEILLDVGRVRDGGQFDYASKSFGSALSGMQDRLFKLGDGRTVKVTRYSKRGNGGYPWYLEQVIDRVADAVPAHEPVMAAENVVPLTRPTPTGERRGRTGQARQQSALLRAAETAAPVANPFSR
ncbi:hypothetical protein EOW65_15775 [Sinirhodobacter ferrireducens]|uniref:Uncharacterized protein n=1 Tax=Paenirhodobacter ferrireducens TaxID=1215032 RepID=A0A443L963_9RHOB|nr:hypothetical protein [Sinirhodobacter ferrireducens]RWR45697.1 hypothetical protein EOW65_15775 [Sinirhodobacter ferrireducens]